MIVSANKFKKLIGHPLKFRLFLLFKLPSAFFCGVRVRKLEDSGCTTSVPYKWLSQNPFRSTYFACLAMAAEMSTGILAMMYTYGQSPAVSMLVVELKAVYHKKATGRTYFTCEDGNLFREAVAAAIANNDARTVVATSTGRNDKNELIAAFIITWSFRPKNK